MAERILLKNASALINGVFRPCDLLLQDGKITRIGAASLTAAGTEPAASMTAPTRIDIKGRRLIPGFIDIHTHGAIGIDFNHASKDEVRKVASFFASQGVTSFLPCVMTDTLATMKRQLIILSGGDLAGGAKLIGIHLEGPFLNPQYKGAMPEALLQACNFKVFKDLQKAASGKIRLITVSPELEGAIDFISQLSEAAVRVSLGHSGASYEETIAAINAGATSATHIMNAMKLLHMHDPAILTAVLESDIYAEMICDGFHLHPPIIRLLLKTKGFNRMIAVSDSTMAAGLGDGKYKLGSNDIIVKNGDALLASDGTRAGSTLTMIKTLQNLQNFSGASLEEISPLLSENPARMLGIYEQTGSIEEGKQADLAVLDSHSQLVMTIIDGKIVYDKSHG